MIYLNSEMAFSSLNMSEFVRFSFSFDRGDVMLPFNEFLKGYEKQGR